MIAINWWAAIVTLASISLPATAAPTRSYCRCVSVDETLPWTKSSAVLDASERFDICSRLGPELEHWRLVDQVGYDAYFADLVEETAWSALSSDELKPLPTGVLMELAARKVVDPYAPPRSAPTERPRERIICRSERAEELSEPESGSSLFYMTVIIIMVVLAFIAECINVAISWFNHVYEAKTAIRLAGGEKDLRAWDAFQKSTFTDGLDANNQLEDNNRLVS
ncbi:hypothetical protein K432DRAFT_396918 [Lepidopterella palustris CBS 459.81]|uniref:Uncharacterized protein n=1 Tax=Lepidopterella palustris CBS 459.81 TaxID=1314670 RepID=A0A8E2E260_9PEZI|nr:hypothetical protein K432DRAFT_396918 [Lepidopterella palustris CBS 459.81]